MPSSHSNLHDHSLLHARTNKIWLANHPDNQFDTTHHTITPSQWAIQLLDNHLSRRYTQHLSTSITAIINQNQYHETCDVSPVVLSSCLHHMHISSYFCNSNFMPHNSFTPLSPHPSLLIASNIT
jgi:hypothetical protein